MAHHENVADQRYQKLAFTVEEAAEMLSLSRAHVYRLLDLRELGSVSIGRSRRITLNQLISFLERLEQADGLVAQPQRVLVRRSS